VFDREAFPVEFDEGFEDKINLGEGLGGLSSGVEIVGNSALEEVSREFVSSTAGWVFERKKFPTARAANNRIVVASRFIVPLLRGLSISVTVSEKKSPR